MYGVCFIVDIEYFCFLTVILGFYFEMKTFLFIGFLFSEEYLSAFGFRKSKLQLCLGKCILLTLEGVCLRFPNVCRCKLIKLHLECF